MAGPLGIDDERESEGDFQRWGAVADVHANEPECLEQRQPRDATRRLGRTPRPTSARHAWTSKI
eukprot:5979334-Pyramimonas_sp.AAC.1